MRLNTRMKDLAASRATTLAKASWKRSVGSEKSSLGKVKSFGGNETRTNITFVKWKKKNGRLKRSAARLKRCAEKMSASKEKLKKRSDGRRKRKRSTNKSESLRNDVVRSSESDRRRSKSGVNCKSGDSYSFQYQFLGRNFATVSAKRFSKKRSDLRRSSESGPRKRQPQLQLENAFKISARVSAALASMSPGHHLAVKMDNGMIN